MSLASAKERKEKNAGGERKLARVSYRIYVRFNFPRMIRTIGNRKMYDPFWCVSRKNQSWNQKIIILFLRWCNACINFEWILSNSSFVLQTTAIPQYHMYHVVYHCFIHSITFPCPLSIFLLSRCAISLSECHYIVSKVIFYFYIQEWKKNWIWYVSHLKYRIFLLAFISFIWTKQ